MDSRGTRITIVCCICAFAGGVLTREFSLNVWVVSAGALLTALLGYLAYDLKAVLRAIPQAWQKARRWNPNRENVRTVVGSIIWLFTLAVPASLFILTFNIETEVEGIFPVDFIHPVVGICLGLAWIVTIAIALVAWIDREDTIDQLPLIGKQSETVTTQRLYFLYNPVILPPIVALAMTAGILYGCYWFLIHFHWLFIGLWRALYLLCRFGVQLFRIIHSDLRLLCALDASLCMLVGLLISTHFIGAVAGAVIGAFVGLINYELVSKRWLKLVPVPVKVT